MDHLLPLVRQYHLSGLCHRDLSESRGHVGKLGSRRCCRRVQPRRPGRPVLRPQPGDRCIWDLRLGKQIPPDDRGIPGVRAVVDFLDGTHALIGGNAPIIYLGFGTEVLHLGMFVIVKRQNGLTRRP